MGSLDQSIVVRSNFALASVHSGVNLKKFVSGYMFRADADEPLVLDSNQHEKYLGMLTSLKTPEDENADEILNHRLRYNGIGFDKDKLALTRDEQLDRANEAQKAYDQGRSVKRMIITFDTQYLKEHGLLDEDDLDDPIQRGSFRGKVDQRRLRTAVSDGMDAMFSESTMHDPQFAAAIQTNTTQVHVHLAVWDQDESVKNDHGKLLARERHAIQHGVDSSLSRQPEYVNEVSDLSNVAQSTQQMARFKRHLLKKELYNSALRLDQASLSEYVDNLSQYDQKVLTNDEREKLAVKIQKDWKQSGRSTKRSHKLSNGQRRMRRQVHAMIRTTGLRREIRRYKRFLASSGTNGRTGVSKSSQPVYDAMVTEAKRQLTIVEKYRAYQRPRVNAIYNNRADELEQRRKDLEQRRQELLKSVQKSPMRSGYVNRLLKRQNLMSNLKEDFDGTPLSQTDVYQDLLKSRDDDTHVLSPKTIKAVVDASDDDDDKKLVDQELSRNQKFDLDALTPQQRMSIVDYQEDLDEYEFDSVANGGLRVKDMHLSSLDDDFLNLPSQTSSIYDQDSAKTDPRVMSVDFDQIISSGPLKPDVTIAIRQNLKLRTQRLQAAHQYIQDTQQQDPKWLVEAKDNLMHQYKVLDKQDGPTVNQQNETEVEGYHLDDDKLVDLVQKHLDDVDGLSR